MTRVLIVEDDPSTLGIMLKMVHRLYDGAAIETAETLAEAKALIAGSLFDAVVLDLELPDSRREDTLKEIALVTQARIIVASGLMEPADRLTAHSEGAALALSKDEFLKRVQDHDPELLGILAPEFDSAKILNGAKVGP